MLGTDDLIGLGVVISLKDAFSSGAQKVIHKLEELEKSAMNSAGAVTRSLREMRTGLAGLAAGGIALGALNYATNRAAEFSSAIARVSTVADAAQMSTEQLRKVTMGLNAQFGGGAAKQADALYEAISAGFTSTTQALEVLTTANKLAVGGVTDVDTATKGLSAVMLAYADKGVKAAHASDLFFVAAAAGTTTIEELSRDLGQVVSVAAATGVSLEELLAGVTTATTVGMSTSSAIAGLTGIIANISRPTKHAAEEAKRLGIEFNTTHLRAVGFQRFLQEIISSPKFAATSLEKLFHSLEGKNTVMAIAAQNGAKFNEVMEAMGKSGGATETAFAKIAATSEYQGKLLTAAINNATIRVGEVLEPVKARIVGAVRAIVDAFNALPVPVIRAITYIGALSFALMGVMGAFLLVKGAMILWPILLGDIAIGIGTIYLALAPLMPLIIALATAAGILYVAWTDDIGGIATSLTDWYESAAEVVDGLVQLFTSSNGGVGQIPAELHDKLVAKGLWPTVEAIYIFGERIMDFLRGAWSGFVAAFKVAASFVTTVARAVLGLGGILWWVAAPIVELVARMFDWSAGSEAASTTMDGLGKVVGFVLGMILALRTGVMLISTATAIWRGIAMAATAVQWIWNIAMAANPIGIVILLIGGLIVALSLLIRYWDHVALAAAQAWRWMKAAVGGDTTDIDATIARLQAKIDEAKDSSTSASPAGVNAATAAAFGVQAPGTAATPAERSAAMGAAAPQRVEVSFPGGPPPQATGRRVIEIPINLNGRQLHRAIVDEDEAAMERTHGVAGPY